MTLIHTQTDKLGGALGAFARRHVACHLPGDMERAAGRPARM
jgi:hypothetical protein